jgi:transcriptional regulator with XRE-family HTH domain
LRELLIRERKRAGLTQVELSDRLGAYRTFITKIEKGDRRLDVIEFLAIADAVGFDPMTVLNQVRE